MVDKLRHLEFSHVKKTHFNTQANDSETLPVLLWLLRLSSQFVCATVEDPLGLEYSTTVIHHCSIFSNIFFLFEHRIKNFDKVFIQQCVLSKSQIAYACFADTDPLKSGYIGKTWYGEHLLARNMFSVPCGNVTSM